MIHWFRIPLRGLLRLHACRRGSAAIEAAFVLPVFLLALLGVFELARIGWEQTALNFAVQEAARCSTVRPDVCGTPTQTAQYAARRTAALGIGADAFTVSAPSCGTRVSATVEHKLIMPIVPSGPTLTAEFCRR